MPLWISSTSAATRHAAYAIERTPNRVIQAIGTGVAGMVGQFPWGPFGTSIYTPTGSKDLIYTIAPPGMDHTNTAYKMATQAAWPTLKIVRALGTTAAAASVTLANSVPTNILTVTAKYPGTAGNSITVTVGPASDGNASHFNLTVQVTGASGTTTEVFTNLDFSTSPANNNGASQLGNFYLTGSLTQLAAGVPVAGTFTMTGGVTGTINSFSYTGTTGAGDQAIAAFEGDPSIRRVFSDDPGNTLRAAVNADLETHAISLGDRIAFINGNSGNTVSAVQTDVANYRSERVAYMDPWVYVNDDITGAKVLIPGSGFGASLHANLSPSTSIAWKDPEARAFLANIVDLEFNRGNAASSNTAQGICTFIKEQGGGISIEAGVTTLAPQDPTRQRITRRSIGDYVASALVTSTRPIIDSPNVPANQQPLVNAVSVFLQGLVTNAQTDPNHQPHILGFDIPPLGPFNTAADLAGGAFTVPADMLTSSGMERVFFSFQFGEGIVIAK